MADYIPVFKPGHDITFTTNAAVTGGQLLVLVTPNTVQPASSASDAWIGVATTDAASGGKVGVTSGGVQELTATGTVTAGTTVMAAASGTVATFSGTNYAQVVGVATTSAAAGAKVRVRFAR